MAARAPRVREGGHVTCTANATEAAGGAETPAGTWAVWSAGSITGYWWLIPHDDAAKAWAVKQGVRWIERHYKGFQSARLMNRA